MSRLAQQARAALAGSSQYATAASSARCQNFTRNNNINAPSAPPDK